MVTGELPQVQMINCYFSQSLLTCDNCTALVCSPGTLPLLFVFNKRRVHDSGVGLFIETG